MSTSVRGAARSSKPHETTAYPYNPRRCPFTATWSVLGGKWKGVLWWRLSNGLGRYSDLQRAIPQVTKKVLTQQLRELERDGIVQRTVIPESPPRVEYALTDYGRSLAPVMDALCAWGAEHLRQPGGTTPSAGGATG